MIVLVRTLRTWGDSIEADFQSEYGLDLWLLASRGEWLRLARLLTRLSEDSRYVLGVRRDMPHAPKGTKPDVDEWHKTDRLLATVIDELAIANFQRAPKGKKPELLTGKSKRRRQTPGEKVDVSAFSQKDIRAALARIAPQPQESS